MTIVINNWQNSYDQKVVPPQLFLTMIFSNMPYDNCVYYQSCLTCVTPWTVAHQAPLYMGILQTRILE